MKNRKDMEEKLLLVFTLVFFSFFIFIVKETEAIDINSCDNLATSGATYILTTDISESTSTRCINITADNVILDCQGHRIDGIDYCNGRSSSSQTYGIYLFRSPGPQFTNITIKNCTLTDWYRGVYIYNTNSSILTNMTVSSNCENGTYGTESGIYLYKVSNSIIANSSLFDNGYADFYIISTSDSECNNFLYNVKGTDNKPIVYYNYTVKIRGWYNNVSGIILCNADNSVIDNLTMIRTGYKNNAIRLVRTDYTNISNTYLENLGSGMQISYVSNNNRLANITAKFNSWDGFYLYSVSNNTLTNITSISNAYGLYISTSSTSNNITNSIFQNSSTGGIYLWSSGNPENLIYNNMFNNTNNTIFSGGTPKNNYWNTTIQPGIRIYSNGPYIGGNYWTNSTGNNQSDTCTDADNDGFCDQNYTLATNNIDYLPLSDKYLPEYCNQGINTSDSTYTIDQSNTYYCLRGNKRVLAKNAVNFNSGVINSTLDCLGYNLDSNDIAGTYGVYFLTGPNTKNNTVKNCKITNFENGIYLNNGPNNNTLINNTVSSNTNGFFLYSSSNNNLTNNIVNSNINGTRLDTNSISNILNNNTIKGNTQYGLYIYSSSKNDIKDGSISDNTNSDYYLNSAGATNNFTKTNFTSLRKIKFNDATSWFNYRNDTGNVWLKTNVFAAVTITRKLTNWNQNLMQWNDSASSTVTAGYNLTGLKSNTWYVVYNDSKPTYVLKTDSGGVINFTVYLNSEHQIKVREEYLIIDSVEIKPIDSPPDTVIPQANSTVYMNVTVNITNSTSLDKCMIRVFGPLDSYLNPTFGLLLGTIKIVNVKTQCFGNWSMRYWRTPGGCTGCLPPWNVSVDLNLTNGLTNFTSKTFIYNELAWTDDSVPTINFTGLPGDYVNSTNAYPLNMQNEGNVYINISINGTDFNWETYPSPQIGVGNVSYNESDTGKFKNLTHVYSLSNAYLAPTETRSLYFKANIPIGFRAQRYNNTIDFNSSFKATEVCNICYKFFNGACQAQNTSLGANLYGCEGSNKKCDSGNCITGQAKQPDSNWYNVTQNDKTYRPSARKRYAMIYAPDYDRVLMFGGDTAAGTVYLNDTWIFNFTDSKWYNVTKSGSPPKRSLIGSSMAYDSVNHRAIFFGGYAGFNYEETWEFNFANEMWYKRNPSASPPARNWVNLVYMSAHDRIILYGGYNNTQAGDTWEYNYTENKWYNVTKGGSCTPPVRGLDWMTYDSDNNRIIKFGGTKGATTFFNDTWIFNYTDSCWYNVTKLPLPPSMDSHSMAYDSESNLTILHGGTLKPGSIITNQTWAFNYTDLKWYNITSELETIPPQVNDHAIVYMLESDRIIRFGGQSNNNVEMDQTWLLNYTNGG